MANQSVVGTESYTLISAAEFYRPELFENVIHQYGDEGFNRFFNVFGPAMGSVVGQGMMLGQAKPVKTPDYWWVERGRFLPSVELNGAATPAAGAETVDINIAVATHNTDQTSTPIRVNDVYYFYDVSLGTVQQVIVTSYTAPTAGPTAGKLKIKPVNITEQLVVAAGDKMIYLGNAFGEGTGPHTGWITEDTKYDGKLQIIKDNFSTTNTANSTYNEVKWQGSFGIPSGNYRVLVDERDAVARQFYNMDNVLLFMEPITNDFADQEITRGTTGLLPLIKSLGYNYDYGSSVVDFTMDDFRTINKRMNQEKCPKEYRWIIGYDLMDQMEEALHDYFNGSSGNTGIHYAAYNGSKSVALSMGVKSFCRGGFTHHFKVWSHMSDPNTLGVHQGKDNFYNSAFMIPSELVMNYGDSDTAYGNVGTNPGAMVPPLLIRYLEGNGANRYLESIEYGTRNGKSANATREDVWGVDYRSEIGLQARNMKDFGWVSAQS